VEIKKHGGIEGTTKEKKSNVVKAIGSTIPKITINGWYMVV
jgi:hypothetical protein